MRLARIGVGIVFSTALVLLPQTEASAYEMVGDWAMEESSGATLMLDSSGHALHGQIGPDVVTGETTGPGTKGYRFKGDWWVVNDDRLVQFPDNPSLDPGTGTFAVDPPDQDRRPRPQHHSEGAVRDLGRHVEVRSQEGRGRGATSATRTTTPRPSASSTALTRRPRSTTTPGT